MATNNVVFTVTIDGSQAIGDARAIAGKIQAELGKIQAKISTTTTRARGGTAGAAGAAAAVAIDPYEQYLAQEARLAQEYHSREGRIQEMMGVDLNRRLAILGRSSQLQSQAMVDGATQLGATGEEIFQQNARMFERDLQQVAMATDNRAYAIRMWSRGGYSEQDIAEMSNVQRWSSAFRVASYETRGLRLIGQQLQWAGQGMMLAGGAGLGAGLALGKGYIDYLEPAQRAAANLQIELSALNDTLFQSTESARQYFTVTQQAESLYKWAAATGVVVQSQGDLNRLLDEQMAPVQQLAAMHQGELDVGMAVDYVSQILSQYNMTLDQTRTVTEDLNNVAAYSQATVTDVGQAFRYVGDISDEMSVSFMDTGSALQIMADHGLRSTRAGRGLAMALMDIVDPSKEAAEAMDSLFGKPYKEVLFPRGQFAGLGTMVEEMATAMSGLTDAEKEQTLAKIFDVNAMRAMLPLINTQIEAEKYGINVIDAMTQARQGLATAEVEALNQMMTAQKGYTVEMQSSHSIWQQMWADFESSDVARADRFKQRWDTAMKSLGESIFQVGIPILESLAGALEKVAATVQEDPKWADVFIKAAGGLLVGGGALSLVGKTIQIGADLELIWVATQMKLAAADIVRGGAEIVAGAELISGSSLGGGARGSLGGGAGIIGVSVLAMSYEAAALIAMAAVGAREMEANAQQRSGLTPAQWDWLTTEGGMGFGAQARSTDVAMRGGGGAPALGYWEPATAGRTSGIVKATQEQINQLLVEAGLATADILSSTTALAEENLRVYVGTQFYTKEVDLWAKRMEDIKGYAQEISPELQLQQDLAGGIAEAFGHVVPDTEGLVGMITEAAEAGKKIFEGTEGVIPGPLQVTLESRYIQELIALFQSLTTAEAGEIEKQVANFNLGWQRRMDAANRAFAQIYVNLGVLTDKVNESMGIYQKATAEYITGAATGAAGGAGGMFERLIGYVPEAQILQMQIEFAQGLSQRLYEAQQGAASRDETLTQAQVDLITAIYLQGWEDRTTGITKYYDDLEAAQKKAAQTTKANLEAFASSVEGMMTPTEVTSADVAATNIGQYRENWDEYARQVRAAMAGSPDFDWMIPEDVKQQGYDAIQAWGKSEIDAFYNGMRLEMMTPERWDAFAADYQAMLDQKLSKKNFVGIAIQELAARGIEASDADVMKALGLESPFQQMFFGGLTPEEAGQELSGSIGTALGSIKIGKEEKEAVQKPGETVGDLISTGMKKQIGAVDWISVMILVWQISLQDKKKQEALVGIGEDIGGYIWVGIQKGLIGSGLIDAIVTKVIEELNGAL